jgi:prepilin-type N-terminal cleavage/methylation domain-containing protein
MPGCCAAGCAASSSWSNAETRCDDLGKRGFTLLEVMVALAIVSIGLIAAFNGIIQMAHSTAVLRERALPTGSP